jgi:hypothetical protein
VKFEVVEGALASVGDEDYVAALSAVCAIGTAARNVLLPMEAHRTRAATPRYERDLSFIEEHRFDCTGADHLAPAKWQSGEGEWTNLKTD